MSFSVQEALDVVLATVPLKGAESISTLAADRALAELWSQYAWRETLGDLDPITLIPGVQDYTDVLANLPSDLGGLWNVFYVQMNQDGGYKLDELRVRRTLERTQVEALPSEVSYQQDAELIRLSNVPPSNCGSPLHFLTGTYKKTAPRVTHANQAGLAFPFDDELFDAYIAAIRWKFFALLGDQRANDAAGAAFGIMEQKAVTRGMRLGSDQIASSINVNGF